MKTDLQTARFSKAQYTNYAQIINKNYNPSWVFFIISFGECKQTIL